MKTYRDITGSKTLNDKLVKTCYHLNEFIVSGHADMVSPNIIDNLKVNIPI